MGFLNGTSVPGTILRKVATHLWNLGTASHPFSTASQGCAEGLFFPILYHYLRYTIAGRLLASSIASGSPTKLRANTPEELFGEWHSEGRCTVLGSSTHRARCGLCRLSLENHSLRQFALACRFSHSIWNKSSWTGGAVIATPSNMFKRSKQLYLELPLEG